MTVLLVVARLEWLARGKLGVTAPRNNEGCTITVFLVEE